VPDGCVCSETLVYINIAWRSNPFQDLRNLQSLFGTRPMHNRCFLGMERTVDSDHVPALISHLNGRQVNPGSPSPNKNGQGAVVETRLGFHQGCT